MTSLLRTEAHARAALLDVTGYTVHLDLDTGEETFESTSTIDFTCREPGGSTFLDLDAVRVHSITLNDDPIDPSRIDGRRLTLTDLPERCTLQVRATMAYSRDGQGLHRAVDHADGRHYVYGHLFLDAAPKVFACFDQPDLKAPYDVTVRAPQDWIVLGNGDPTRTSPGEWRLSTTKPLATYFVTVCAGPYVSVHDEHRGVPLGVHVRASLEDELREQAPQILEVTKQSFDYYDQLFGVPYEYGEYHQVFVPEFNAGAMENPGCVTFRDQYVFRGAYTRNDVMTRSSTIAHEMAHMWFGDMVTLRWWDDLWLNESFAEYMSHRTLDAATEFAESWVDFGIVRKLWGYGVEHTPSTHPVAGGEAPDAASALMNFDGISYAKGASVLRQLIAFIGDEAFVAGIRAYLAEHRHGNAAFADFLSAMERSSGTDLQDWAQAWLRTEGRDTIAVRLDERDSDGEVSSATVTVRSPQDHPAHRPHRVDVAGYAGEATVLTGETTAWAGQPATVEVTASGRPDVLVPNASDLTWAMVELDPATQAALPDHLASVPDDPARVVVWGALLDGVRTASVDPRHVHRVFMQAWPLERSLTILATVPRHLGPPVLSAVRQEEQDGIRADRAHAAQQVLDRHQPGSPESLVAARLLAATTSDTDLLRAWSHGEQLPVGLESDDDIRWAAVTRLVVLGEAGDREIDAVHEQDRTMSGDRNALRAKASAPTDAAKSWAWQQITEQTGRSNYELNFLATGFWRTSQRDLLEPYVDRYFADVPAMVQWVGEDALQRVAELTFPWPVVTPATRDAADAALARTDLSPAVRRAMVDARSHLDDALRSLERFAG
ncbi:aminopeptidase N [Luteipulveratus sp. YIM 133132]|uniref:Aminopeptidase N n=1 Tax=Luteipulveratus flavus TaxID=3031728 RepID=A0ABT6C907_9MICO|nr:MULTISPECIES: aminopeptidase N [unclassified Luteipulveratus]MDE9365145.1 aminopeptidase N [Luteipulveratus sp. YIM 133132]MDF8264519.1 aminopeptidase N [Luteipulveratus sp. YIM 133296]